MKYLLTVVSALALTGCDLPPPLATQGEIAVRAIGCFEGSVIVRLQTPYASFMYKLDSAGKTVPCPKGTK